MTIIVRHTSGARIVIRPVEAVPDIAHLLWISFAFPFLFLFRERATEWLRVRGIW